MFPERYLPNAILCVAPRFKLLSAVFLAFRNVSVTSLGSSERSSIAFSVTSISMNYVKFLVVNENFPFQSLSFLI